MSNPTNTPRTDAAQSAIKGFFSCATVPATFAARLEIENGVLRDALEPTLAALKKAREYVAHYGTTSDSQDDKDMVDAALEKAKYALANTGKVTA